MGGQQGKSADDTSDEIQSRPVDSDQALASGRETDVQSGSGDNALSRFRQWISVSQFLPFQSSREGQYYDPRNI